MRIAQKIARSGLCSRREAEQWIASRQVTLNGQPVLTPATTVAEHDLVAIDGQPLTPAPPAGLWRYHKPSGLLTTHRDERGRSTIFEQLPAGHLMTIGRLDLNSEGLLLLTNDGMLARSLELPANRWQRRYRVRVYGQPDKFDRLPERLAELASGITLDGVRYDGIEACLDPSLEAGAKETISRNTWLRVNLYEGKNRTIRKVMADLGLRVNRLIRIGFGPFALDGLARGRYQPVSQVQRYLTASHSVTNHPVVNGKC